MTIHDILKNINATNKYKMILQEHNIQVKAVSRYLGISYSYTSSLLCDTHPMTPRIEAELQKLIVELERPKRQKRR